MSDETFAALVKRCKPGVSVRSIEAAASLKVGVIANFLKPAKRVPVRRRMPTRDVILEIARALECEPSLVVRAFANDLRIPIDELELSVEEVTFVELLRVLSPQERSAVRTLAENLAAGRHAGDTG